MIEALESVQHGVYAETWPRPCFRIDEHVFTSRTESWFRSTIDPGVSDLSDRYGTAHLVDGPWVLRRAAFCADLSLAGARCDPPEPPSYPPSWYARYGRPGSGCEPGC